MSHPMMNTEAFYKVMASAVVLATLVLRMTNPEEFDDTDQYTQTELGLTLSTVLLETLKEGLNNVHVYSSMLLAKHLLHKHESGELHLLNDCDLNVENIRNSTLTIIKRVSGVTGDKSLEDSLNSVLDEAVKIMYTDKNSPSAGTTVHA